MVSNLTFLRKPFKQASKLFVNGEMEERGTSYLSYLRYRRGDSVLLSHCKAGNGLVGRYQERFSSGTVLNKLQLSVGERTELWLLFGIKWWKMKDRRGDWQTRFLMSAKIQILLLG